MGIIKKIVKREFSTTEFLKMRIKAQSGGCVGKYFKLRYKNTVNSFGAFIPVDCAIGKGICFPHGIYGVFISSGAIVGDNCVIFHQVTIGSNTLVDSKGKGAPTIGDNVYIGCGAKIIGNVKIGNNVRIGANCVVTQDVPDNSTIVLPKPVMITHETALDNKFLNYKDFCQRKHD